MNSLHAQATALGLAFEAKGVQLTRGEKLEAIAKIQGFKDFNTAVAQQSKPSDSQVKELQELLRSVVLNALHRGRKNLDEVGLPALGTDAPGHSHRKAGVWDWDNGALAGLECQWCKSWNKALSLLHEQEKARA